MLYAQEQRNTCAVAALRSVLSEQFGIQVPEVALEALGTVADFPIRINGTTSSHLRRMVREADRAFNTGPKWRLRIRRRGTIPELGRECRAGRYPLVSVVHHTGELHMVVVLSVDSRVRYWDPDGGKRRWALPQNFRRSWVDPEGRTWYAVVY